MIEVLLGCCFMVFLAALATDCFISELFFPRSIRAGHTLLLARSGLWDVIAISRESIARLTCAEYEVVPTRGRVYVQHRVSAILLGGQTRRLIDSLDSPEEARFIAREMNDSLGIKEVRGPDDC